MDAAQDPDLAAAWIDSNPEPVDVERHRARRAIAGAEGRQLLPRCHRAALQRRQIDAAARTLHGIGSELGSRDAVTILRRGQQQCPQRLAPMTVRRDGVDHAQRDAGPDEPTGWRAFPGLASQTLPNRGQALFEPIAAIEHIGMAVGIRR